MVCDEIITLNADQASCFTDNFDTVLKAIEATPEGRFPVNMNGCALGDRNGQGIATRGGILTMPDLPERPALAPEEGKSVYLLDRSGAECLRNLLTARAAELDPSATFDLYELCAN
ncbi:hypothetical protein [Tropicibacter naphthalenivorans]|nr:hypothetical protein [Tropicibacter naphthalenivorans]